MPTLSTLRVISIDELAERISRMLAEDISRYSPRFVPERGTIELDGSVIIEHLKAGNMQAEFVDATDIDIKSALRVLSKGGFTITIRE